MSEERTHYDAGQKSAPGANHVHLFHYVASNKYIVRYCDRCGRSWALSQMREIIHNRTIACWSEVLEEEAAKEKLFE